VERKKKSFDFRKKFRRVFPLSQEEDATKTCGPSAPRLDDDECALLDGKDWQKCCVLMKKTPAPSPRVSTTSRASSSSSFSCDRRNTKENCRFRFPFELEEK
jgi:hypothetical protein